MDSDSFIPQFWKAQFITGLTKLVSQTIETQSVKLKELAAEQGINAIKWLNGKGETREYIEGQSAFEEQVNFLRVGAQGVVNFPRRNTAHIQCECWPTPSESEIKAVVGGGGLNLPNEKKILDGLGESDFLFSNNLIGVWGGTGAVEVFSGNESTIIEFQHNLGVVPIVVASAVAPTGYNLTLEARPLAGHTDTVRTWIQVFVGGGGVPGPATFGVNVVCFS